MHHNYNIKHNNIHSLNKSFIIGIVLNIIFIIIEFIFGIYYNSLGLLSDAGHNLGDVASLVLAMLAFRLSILPANKQYTYGYKKSTILVSLINAIILFAAVGFIISESIKKINSNQYIEGEVIIWVAVIGVVINAITALFFLKDKDRDLNVKGAYLHMLMDALVSIGVVISGIIILFTQWYIVDVIVGLIIAVIISISSFNLLRNSLQLVLDGVPLGMDTKNILEMIQKEDGVIDVHHLHLWAISTTENALTAHIVIDNVNNLEIIKRNIKNSLEKFEITHSTLEFETKDAYKSCEDKNISYNEIK